MTDEIKGLLDQAHYELNHPGACSPSEYALRSLAHSALALVTLLAEARDREEERAARESGTRSVRDVAGMVREP